MVAAFSKVAVIVMVWLSSSSSELTLVVSVIATSPFPSSNNPNCSTATYPEAVVAAAMITFSFNVLTTAWSFATLYIFTTLSVIVAPSLYAFITFFEKPLMLLKIPCEFKICKFWILNEL